MDWIAENTLQQVHVLLLHTDRNIAVSLVLVKNYNLLIICRDSGSLKLLSLFVHTTLVLLREAVARKVREETKQLLLRS